MQFLSQVLLLGRLDNNFFRHFFNNTKAKKSFQLFVIKSISFLFLYQISKRFIFQSFLNVLFSQISNLLKSFFKIKLLKRALFMGGYKHTIVLIISLVLISLSFLGQGDFLQPYTYYNIKYQIIFITFF